jgi:hypothetical protein
MTTICGHYIHDFSFCNQAPQNLCGGSYPVAGATGGSNSHYLERDLRELAAIDSLPDFQRVMRSVCLRLGSVLNQIVPRHGV